MKLDLLTNATVIDDAIKFVAGNSNSNSNCNKKNLQHTKSSDDDKEYGYDACIEKLHIENDRAGYQCAEEEFMDWDQTADASNDRLGTKSASNLVDSYDVEYLLSPNCVPGPKSVYEDQLVQWCEQSCWCQTRRSLSPAF